MTTIKPPVVFTEVDFFQESNSGKRMICLTAECAAEKANEILSQRLKETAKVVYRHDSSIEVGNWCEEGIEPNPTHRALLINIEEIPKPPVKKEIKEITARINLHGNIVGMSEDLSYLKGTPVKITVEEL